MLKKCKKLQESEKKCEKVRFFAHVFPPRRLKAGISELVISESVSGIKIVSRISLVEVCWL